MTKNALLISIRPQFAEMIFSGIKTVELRRVCPKMSAGDLAIVYVSSPSKQLQGAFEIGKIISEPPLILWKKVGGKTGISQEEFLTYFKGKSIAHAISIRRAWKFSAPMDLGTLRLHEQGFRPPQSFHYVKRNEPSLLSALAFIHNN